MRTSEVASQAGVNVQTLRYYERRGLLPEPKRLDSGYRSYGPEAVRTARFVKRAQTLGFTLEEVEALLQLAAGGPRGCAEARQLAAEKLADLQQRIEALEAMRRSLTQLVATCDRPRSRRQCPLLEALADGDEDVDGSGGEREARFISRFEGFELLPHLVRLLADGRPVEPRQVAEAAGLPVREVEGFLRVQPGTDWDDDGRIAGFGLTLRPTALSRRRWRRGRSPRRPGGAPMTVATSRGRRPRPWLLGCRRRRSGGPAPTSACALPCGRCGR
ncbi:MAG: MerR family transcriptional regulator [Acidimicrobiales bacterium]